MNTTVDKSQKETTSLPVTAALHPVVRYLEPYGPLTNEDRAFLLEKTGRLNLPKQHIICAEGTVCYHMYLLADGLIRTHYNKDGRNVTTGFLTEGAIFTPLSSFLNRRSATYTIETLEPTTLYQIHYDDLRELFRRSHVFEHVSREATLNSLVALESRLYALQFYSAQERYENFLAAFPDMVNRVSLTHLASYLGISLETLSRIRSNLTNVKQKR